MQELAASADSGLTADAEPEGNGDPGADQAGMAAASSQPKKGGRFAGSSRPQAGSQAGRTAADGKNGLAAAAVPVDARAARPIMFSIGGGLQGKGEAVDVQGSMDTGTARTDPATTTATDADGGRLAAKVGPGGEAGTRALASVPIPFADLARDAAFSRLDGSEIKNSPVETTARGEVVRSPRGAGEPGGKDQAPQPTGEAKVAEPRADDEDCAARSTPANEASAISLADFTSMAVQGVDSDGAATPQVQTAEAGAKDTSQPAAEGANPEPPAAPLAFAARLSMAPIDRVRRAAGMEGSNPDEGGRQSAGGAAVLAAPPPDAASQPAADVASDTAATGTIAPAASATTKTTAETGQPSGTVAHDIKLELAGTGPRVEVRLVERAGEVHVAVRTPDGKLAQAMRDDLPSLAARLEQNGFHGSEWRAGAASGGQRTIEITPPGRSAPEMGGDPGRRGQQQGQEQDQERERPRTHPNGSRNTEFASLVSALRGPREER